MWPWSKRRVVDEAEQAMVDRRVSSAVHRADELSTRLRGTVDELVAVLDPQSGEKRL